MELITTTFTQWNNLVFDSYKLEYNDTYQHMLPYHYEVLLVRPVLDSQPRQVIRS
jgi:hypothetical protein